MLNHKTIKRIKTPQNSSEMDGNEPSLTKGLSEVDSCGQSNGKQKANHTNWSYNRGVLYWLWDPRIAGGSRLVVGG